MRTGISYHHSITKASKNLLDVRWHLSVFCRSCLGKRVDEGKDLQYGPGLRSGPFPNTGRLIVRRQWPSVGVAGVGVPQRKFLD